MKGSINNLTPAVNSINQRVTFGVKCVNKETNILVHDIHIRKKDLSDVTHEDIVLHILYVVSKTYCSRSRESQHIPIVSIIGVVLYIRVVSS